MRKFLIPGIAIATALIVSQKAVSAEPPIRKGAEVTIMSVAKDKKTIEVRIQKEPAVGPNVTTPEIFADAVGLDSNRSLFLKNPAKFMSTVFILQKDLELLMPYPPAQPEAKPAAKKK